MEISSSYEFTMYMCSMGHESPAAIEINSLAKDLSEVAHDTAPGP